jgi:sortase (surface protein transpeptidase)
MANNLSNPRAVYKHLRLAPRRSLLITFRHFKTAKANRSKKYRQIVLQAYFSPYKEIAVRYQKRPKPRKVSALRRSVRFALPIVLMAVGVAGTIYFGVQAGGQKKLEPSKTFAAPVQVKKDPSVQFLPKSLPTHISVPSVGIDASVTSVGKDASGGIQMPPLFAWTTGWYNLSPTPGEKGPAIIVGHVDTYKGVSVFWNLRNIQPGAIIQINRQDGKVAKFKVDSLKQFPQNAFPTKEVYGNINYSGIRLITCGGAFDKGSGQYTQNTVVYASLTT